DHRPLFVTEVMSAHASILLLSGIFEMTSSVKDLSLLPLKRGNISRRLPATQGLRRQTIRWESVVK
ncbi:MAG: hypothetical protein WHS90_03875, partial [Caldilinea sp.]|uniref:hypothetical protein n=1 Tax=Caldilinea sp. TaxID=2293560 RepID=UPI0030B797FB